MADLVALFSRNISVETVQLLNGTDWRSLRRDEVGKRLLAATRAKAYVVHVA